MPEFTGKVTEPGLYPDIPETVYHMDPVAHPWGSLSVTAARLLVPPAPAAKFDYARKHGRLPSKSQKLGTLAHGLVLGSDSAPEVMVLDYDDWRTKAAREQRDAYTDEGYLVVLRKDYGEARAIADAVLSSPTAAGLLADAEPEVSMFWQDEEFGIWLRGRMDGYSPDIWDMPVIVDLKTSKDASPEEFARSTAEYGYARQDVHYRQGLARLLGCEPDDVDFVFIVVESEPPYLTATYRVSEYDRDQAFHQLRAACERFRDCSESGNWPGYSEEIETLELSRYKRQQMERDLNEWYGI